MWKMTAWFCLAAASAQALGATPEEAARLFEARQWAEAASAYESIVDREPGNALALIRLARARAANGEDVAALEALKAWFATGSASFQAAMTRAGIRVAAGGPSLHRHRRAASAVQLAGIPPVRFLARRLGRRGGGCAGHGEPQPDHARLRRLHGARGVHDAAWLCGHQPQFLRRDAQGLAPDLDRQPGRRSVPGRRPARPSTWSCRRPWTVAEIQRITWTPLDGGRVRQHWESTTDGGKTWVTAFDGLYTRRATAAASTP